MQTPPSFQQYPPGYPQYPPQGRGGGTATLAIVGFIISIIAIVLTVVLNFDAFVKPKGGEDPGFIISDFSIEKTESDFSYSTWIYYTGSGTITTEDEEHDYLVIMRVTLISGGSGTNREESYYTVTVVDGVGEFSTYDSGYENYITRPNYDFEIVGYVLLEN
jgi:hypothetical protein